MEIMDIIQRRGLDDFNRVFRLAEYAITADQETSHLVFAYNCEGLFGFTVHELCEIFLHAKWVNQQPRSTI